MRVDPRFRFVARVVVAVDLVLIAIALLCTVFRAPTVVVDAAWLIAIGSWFVLFQAYLLAGVVLEKGIARNSATGLAVTWAPWELASGALMLVVGVLLLAPVSAASAGVRTAGAFAAMWGALALSTAVLALRKKRKERIAAHT